MQIITTMWKYYALLSAFFAALTAVFAKIGVKDVDSDLATAIRTTVILIITWGLPYWATTRATFGVFHRAHGCSSFFQEQLRGCHGSFISEPYNWATYPVLHPSTSSVW